MSKVDTVNEQSVEENDSIESDIAALMAAAEDEADEVEGNKKAVQSSKEAEASDSEDEQTEELSSDAEPGIEADSGNSVDADEELPEDDSADTIANASPDDEDGDESKPDKLKAPEHWSASDQELFTNQPKESQEFLLKRHKEMEGDYTRKSQEIADTKRQYDAVRDALAPHEADFSRAGLDQAGAVRQLASWHNALKTGGKPALAELAKTYGIDMAEPEIEDDFTDPAVKQTQRQLADIQKQLTRNEQAAQQQTQNELTQQIQQFEQAKDADGKLSHPHFQTVYDQMVKMFQAEMVSDLDDAYNKALMLRPDLKPAEVTKAVIPKANQAEIVKKAKTAATGIRSSGAVGKQSKDLSLRDEIASLMQ